MDALVRKENVLPGVDVTLGEIRVSSIVQEINDPNVKVYTLDTHTKYPQVYATYGDEDVSVGLYADERTLRPATDPARTGKPTTFDFQNLPEGTWLPFVEAGRYTVTIILRRTVETKDEDWASIEPNDYAEGED